MPARSRTKVDRTDNDSPPFLETAGAGPSYSDEYGSIKGRIVERVLRPEDRQHLTELDVQRSFDIISGTKGSRLEETRKAAKALSRRYANRHWWYTLVKDSFPILQFVKTYKRWYILVDLAAGLSVGVASIPMGMSYARLAGLPPAHGLYNNLIFPLVYMIFGTGRQVCVGASAIEAMMSAEAVANVVGWKAEQKDWLDASIGLALFVGIAFITFRILGLGVIASFLADPVLNGFSTGSALVIATSQLKDVLGLNVPRVSTCATWLYVLRHLQEAQWACFLITVCGVFMLLCSAAINKRWCKRFPVPGSLLVICVFGFISWLMQLDEPPHEAIWYSIVYFVIHISIAKTLAQQRGYLIKPNQELLAVGLSSVCGSFFQCFPVATSLSRSSIANVVGAHTPLHHIANCGIIALTLTLITPLLYYLPLAALSSIVLFGVYFMADFGEAWRLLRLFSVDFVLWIACFLATVLLGAMEGVIVGVSVSLLWLLKKNAFPHTAVLGRLPGTVIFRNVERFPMACEVPGCRVLRFDASMNFANADHFEQTVSTITGLDVSGGNDLKSNNSSAAAGIRAVIIDASSINDLDVTAIRMLQVLAQRLQLEKRVLLFANWKGPMRDFLERAHFYDVVPPEHCFLSIMDAVQWARIFFLDPTMPAALSTTVTVGSPAADADGGEKTLSTPTLRYVTEMTKTIERQWAVLPSALAEARIDPPEIGGSKTVSSQPEIGGTAPNNVLDSASSRLDSPSGR